jgi:hypothetical protein
MFRGLGSWLGLQQPAASDEQSPGDAPPEQSPETVAESTEEERQPAEDQELFHQAKDLGSESLPDPRMGWELPLGFEAGQPEAGRGVERVGEEGVSVSQSCPGRERLVRIWAGQKPHLAVKSCP